MKNLTSELVEEFRRKWSADEFVTESDSSDLKKVEDWMIAAFDRVRKEGRREAVEYIKRNWKEGQTSENAYTILEAASGDIAS